MEFLALVLSRIRLLYIYILLPTLYSVNQLCDPGFTILHDEFRYNTTNKEHEAMQSFRRARQFSSLLLQSCNLFCQSLATANTHSVEREHTGLLNLDLIRLQLQPRPVNHLVREDGPQEHLGERTHEGFISRHLPVAVNS